MTRLLTNPRVIAAALIIAGVIAVALWPEPVEVDVVRVGRGPMLVTIDEEGETRVRDRFVVSAPVSGRLQRIELEPGDTVVRGRTVVARLIPAAPALLDQRTIAELTAAVEAARAAVGQAQAERDRAAAALARAQSSLRRQQELSGAGLSSRDDLELAQTTVKTGEEAQRAAEFNVTRAERQLQAARARLAPSTAGGGAVEVIAPVSGVVLKRVRESESVVPVGDPLLEIGDPANLEIVADLLSTDAVKVSPGAPVLIDQWGGDHPLNARVRRVEPSGFTKISALGVEEQRVNIVIELAGDAAAARQLGDGYRVEVRVVIWRDEMALTVPIGALFRRGGDQWAAFVVKDQIARLQIVQLGQRNDREGQITGGLAEGQAVVLHPPDILQDGQKVIIRTGR